jgi:predicted transcriptional regulator
MSRQLLIELPDDVAANAESEAKRLARSVDAVVEEALVDYLGWRAVEEARAANTDLDASGAEQLAYEELGQLRAERARG